MKSGETRLRGLSEDELDWIQYTFDLEHAASEEDGEGLFSGLDDDNLIELESSGLGLSYQKKRPAEGLSCSASSVFSDSSELLGSPDASRTPMQWLSSGSLELHFDDAGEENSLRRGNESTPTKRSQKATGSSPVSDGAASPEKKRRLKRSESSLNSSFREGRWQPDELALLLHVTKNCYDKDIKVICDIVTLAGLNRPRRAVDKQLKRMLKYEKWATRENVVILDAIENLYNSGKVKELEDTTAFLVEQCKENVLLQASASA